VFSSNYTLYGDMSKRVMETLCRFVPRVEIYSIDEAFLDMNGFYSLDYEDTAHYIRATIKQNVGIPISVGVAPTKTLAKMANRWAKKHVKETGIYVLDTREKLLHVLSQTPVEDIWGIGGQQTKRLKINGIHTALDLSRANDAWIQKELQVVGARLVNELRCIPSIPWEDSPPAKKNICTSRSFGKLLTDKSLIAQATASYAAKCAAKLRGQQSCAKLVHVFIHTNIHKADEPQYFRSINLELPVATNSTKEVIHYALRGLDIIYQEGYRFKKTGVIVMDIVPESQVQMGLFDSFNRSKDKKLMRALDGVNTAFGRDLVRFAAQGYSKEWHLRAQKCSKQYTTNINDIITIEN
jgi:DNA polymerase V